VTCIHCGLRKAIVDDGDPVSCSPCVMRLADIAGRPRRFLPELAALVTEHHDVVDIVACRIRRVRWSWTRAWPEAGDLGLLDTRPPTRALGEAYAIAVALS